jgi:tetratricopeptide (TPR) repeat protein
VSDPGGENVAQAHLEKGRDLHEQGRLEEAEAHYRAALVTHPEHPGVLLPLGMLCIDTGRFEEAAHYFELVKSKRADLPIVHLGLGNAMNAMGRPSEALASFERLRTLDPRNPAGFYGSGLALQSLGRVNDARHAFERAVALAPRFPPYHYSLAMTGRFTENDPRLPALEELVRHESVVPEALRVELHFALAKAHDDLKHYEIAFQHLQTGNGIKRRLVSYDEQQEMELFKAITDAFSSDLLAAKRAIRESSDVPVFVVGMPRSGTSLIEQILASHPNIFGAGELTYMYRLVASGLAGANFPSDISSLSAEALGRFGGYYATRISSLAPQAKRVVDKLPANIRMIGLIHLALPSARIIHVRRDPRDTCLSCYFNLFSQNVNFTYDLGELGRYHRAYDDLMAHWRAVLPEGAMLEVQYETLVDHLEEQSRRLIEYCGLDWDRRCLSFHQTERVVHTVSATQVHEQIYRSSIGRWLPYKAHLQPLFDALGIASS